MASRSSIGAVHYCLVFFVMTTIALGTMWYMTHGEYVDALASKKESDKKAADNKTQYEKYFDQIGWLKDKIGHNLDEVGQPDGDDANTVLRQMQLDIDNLGGARDGKSYVETLRKLREELDLLREDYASINREKIRVETELQQTVDAKYTDPVLAATRAQSAAEQRANQADQQRQEQIRQMDAELAQRRTQVNDLQEQLDKLQEDFELKRKSMENDITLLKQVNTQLRERLDVVQKISFEQPDGVIRKVDHTTGLVWVNLGSADDLPPRTSFSVYTKTHHGVGRGEDDIKGAIEITRVLGPHLAEARILDEDYSKPIASNDPVYTPIWSPGRKHRFGVIGLIDIDGNDISDRQQFHEIVTAAGGMLDIEVDDEGRKTGGDLTVHHKFLVMGEIPDPTLEIDIEKQQMYERMMEARKNLVDDARIKGVRIVSLDLFLEWSGFRPQRRLWRPGDEVPWTLKGGGHATAVDEKATEFEAAGQVSKVYGNKRRLRSQNSSSGQTSKVFGRNY